ncbi:MAG: adenine phosphoribosyltransferase [Bacteroidetes bacterium]|jgi:adenine phosphoribosyltransferase|nr:adenine phosphoribosyltransferase [Bacteroidota bacterium]
MHEPLKNTIRSIPDFPKKGIVFRDITTLLKNPVAFNLAADLLYERYRDSRIAKVVSAESRGYILGSVLAYRLHAGFVPVRKPGKLPAETIREEYKLEYGSDVLEMHTDAVQKGERVLVHDDLLATGGTIEATCRLVERAGGVIVGLAFLIELDFLKGRDRLKHYDVFSLIRYESE